MSQQIPDKPEGFVADHSACSNMTDYKGRHYTRDNVDLGKLWSIVSQRWVLNQGGFAPTDVVACMDREQVIKEIEGGEV